MPVGTARRSSSTTPFRDGPNVATPSGEVYPNGVSLVPANPQIQATVRPEGAVFVPSVGYRSVRNGRTRFQNARGPGIHFTPQRYAEDVGQFGGPDQYPAMVDTTAVDYADVADLPGSDRLDDQGALTADAGNANQGVKLAEGADTPSVAAPLHNEVGAVPDMGDRQANRPLTGAFWNAVLHNPVGVFREDYRKNPIASVVVAGAFVGLAYAVGREFERAYNQRRRPGVTGTVGTVPAAAVQGTGRSVREATGVVNDAVTEAGKASEEAISAAGDAVEAAGKAAETVTKDTAKAATD